MKKSKYVLTIFIFVSIFINSFTAEKTQNQDDLGRKIFFIIESQNQNALIDLIASKEDIIRLVESFSLNDSIKESFKMEVIEKMFSNSEDTKNKILINSKEISQIFQCRKCKKNLEVFQIKSFSQSLKKIPIEIGNIEISFRCGRDINSIKVEVINTLDGWKILEKLRLLKY